MVPKRQAGFNAIAALRGLNADLFYVTYCRNQQILK